MSDESGIRREWRVFLWGDEIIVAKNKSQALDVLRENFTRQEILRFVIVESLVSVITFVDGASEDLREYGVQQAAEFFDPPCLIPEWGR